MPCILIVRVIAARNLPIMDWSTDLTDAFVEINFADFDNKKTHICKRTLNPVWEQDFRFEISDESILQSECLELHVLDYDQISSNGSIGITYIDLNPLLAGDNRSQISGWLPIFDSIRGISGEINCSARLQSFGGLSNRITLPSEVGFYTTEIVSDLMHQVSVMGFVSATVTDEDPEQHWSDNFRSQRMSNEARARIMFKIAGKLRRKLGKRVSLSNGNAVIGIRQNFVVEREDGKIMGRAIGTVVRIHDGSSSYCALNLKPYFHDQNYSTPNLTSNSNRELNTLDANIDEVNSIYDGSTEMKRNNRAPELGKDTSALRRESITSTEYEGAGIVLTIRHFPHGSVSEIGGIVSAISVKNIEDDNARTREIWWDELREELISHSRFLFCQSVIGYTETCSVYDDIMVLHCMGTAANIDLSGFNNESRFPCRNNILRDSDAENICSDEKKSHDISPAHRSRDKFKEGNKHPKETFCKILHAPYDRRNAPYPMRLKKCNICRSRYVPEVIFTTIELSPLIPRSNSSELMEAFTSYELKGKYSKSNTGSPTFNEVIPFMQYDMHKQFLYKMRLFGFNAIHCLNTRVAVAGTSITAVSTGTGLCLYALPIPPIVELKPSAIFNYGASESDSENRRIIAKVMDIREEISTEVKNAVHPEDSRSDFSSSSSSSSASAYVGSTGTTIINLDDEPCNDSSLSVGYISTPCFKVTNSSFINNADAHDHVSRPDVYARPAVVSVIRCATVTPGPLVARQISVALNQIFDDLSVHFCYLKECNLTNIDYNIMRIKGNLVLMILTASSLGTYYDNKDINDNWILPSSCFSPNTLDPNDFKFESLSRNTNEKSTHKLAQNQKPNFGSVNSDKLSTPKKLSPASNYQTDISKVIITPLYSIPNMKISHFLGRISFHLVREASFVYSSDNVSKFYQSFITEVYAVVRTHVLSLGGNAMLGYSVDQVIMNNNFKTHGYAVLSVSGDAARVA